MPVKVIATSCLFVLCLGTLAQAGLLENHASAYNDGNGPDGGAWRGTVAYNDGSNTLVGTIDYAVFSASAFTAAFPGSGYVPTADELVYAYQVRNGAGSAPVSLEAVGANPANNISHYQLEVGDIAPSFQQLIFGTAEWNFQSPNVGAGENSNGLVYSSPNRPAFGPSVTFDGGVFATADVPAPGFEPFIPEPATLLVGLIGITLSLAVRRSRRD